MPVRLLGFIILLTYISCTGSNTDEITPLPSLRGEEKIDVLNERLKDSSRFSLQERLAYGDQALKLAIALNDKRLHTKTLRNIGNLYKEVNNYDRALDYFQTSLEISQRIKDHKSAAISLEKIGLIHKRLDKHKKALDFFLRALAIRKKRGDRKAIAISLNNIGLVYKNLYDYDRALEYSLESLAIKKKLGDEKGMSASMNNIGLIYRHKGNKQKALDYLLQSLDIKEKLGIRKGLSISLLNIGLIYEDLSDYDKSLEYFIRALKIRESLGDKSRIANALNSIGVIYMKLEDYDKALEYHQHSLRIYEKSTDRKGMSLSLGNIGIVYGRLGKYQKALNYHKRARAINEGLNSKEGVANTLNNIGDVYRNLEEYRAALEHHEEALKINKEISNRDGMANSLNNIGLTYMHLKKYEQAVEYFQDALEIKKEINDKNGTAEILVRLGEIYIQTGRFKKAGGYIEDGLALAGQIKAKDTLKDCYKALSDLNHKKKDFEQAFKYFTLYAAVKDSMLSRDSSNKIARLRTRMVAETEQQKKKIEILKRDNAIKGLNLNRERLMKGIYMTAIFVFALLILIVLYMYRIKSKSGRQLRIAFENSLYEIAERERIESEKQLLQEELFQAQKMDSIGMLAGGIAHDFNNLLTGIMGYAEILTMKFKDNKGVEGRAAQTIYKNSLTAQELTKQILGFARKGKYNPVPLNLNDVINEALSVSGKIFEGSITVNCRLEDRIHLIDGDQSQLVQVLTNLIINARDAMPNGGEITLQTENVYVDEEDVRSFSAIIKPGHYVRLAISDTGAGIPREIKNRIFEPFFTTKEKGKGTGLGLATVYGIVRNHSGCIFCQSEPGQGTTFVILLPFGKKELHVTVENETNVPGMGTILVADDEEYIRQLSRDFLERMGYHVLTAANGKEAVDIYKNNPGCIDMVLLDIVMPIKDGEETFRDLKALDPIVKVLLFSGFSMNKRVNDILKDGAKGFVEKPFTMKGLSAAVNKVIKSGAN